MVIQISDRTDNSYIIETPWHEIKCSRITMLTIVREILNDHQVEEPDEEINA